jgi:enoyl-CoA hydratase/carnithine racemase
MSAGSTGDGEELVTERRGPVMIVRLNRPDARNALTPTLMRALGAAVIAAESDPDVRAVVLTGTGDRAFCAGMDLKAFASGVVALDEGAESQAFLRLLRGEVAVPLVGAANGAAVAGGLELLLGCDLIVLAEGSRLGLPEVKRGLFAAGGGTFIGRRIPLSIALELTLTGESIDAARALALGLANAVVPADDVVPVAVAYAEQIAANGPLAIQATKELVRLGATDPAAAWERLRAWQPQVFGSEDAREGAIAFMERRPPVWRGR